ncbi:MAG: hypothetical protein JRH15_12145, partial [Deltaproteobacteria bacterium]|nr:hypothetical protein [Deltaproteobacteria bacterium]
KLYRHFTDSLAQVLESLSNQGILDVKDCKLLSGLLIVMLEGKDFYGYVADDMEEYQRLRGFLKEMILKILGRQ